MTELEERKEEYQEEGGTVNMCEGIRGLIEDATAICEEDIRLVQSWFEKWKKKRR